MHSGRGMQCFNFPTRQSPIIQPSNNGPLSKANLWIKQKNLSFIIMLSLAKNWREESQFFISRITSPYSLWFLHAWNFAGKVTFLKQLFLPWLVLAFTKPMFCSLFPTSPFTSRPELNALKAKNRWELTFQWLNGGRNICSTLSNPSRRRWGKKCEVDGANLTTDPIGNQIPTHHSHFLSYAHLIQSEMSQTRLVFVGKKRGGFKSGKIGGRHNTHNSRNLPGRKMTKVALLSSF